MARRTALAGFVAFAPDALTPLGGYPGTDERGETVTLYAEAYDNRRSRDPQTAVLTAQLLDDRGEVAQAVTIERARERGDGFERYRFLVHLPLDVEPGTYVIQLETRTR